MTTPAAITATPATSIASLMTTMRSVVSTVLAPAPTLGQSSSNDLRTSVHWLRDARHAESLFSMWRMRLNHFITVEIHVGQV